MNIVRNNDVKTYEVSSKKILPYWLDERKRRKLLKNDIEMQKRIELLQDFNMPNASTRISHTPDCNYILTSGIYKPRIRCYEVNEFALKFERCLDSEISSFQVLSDDYSKLALLLSDRNIEIHSQEGVYYSLRIPHFGRDLLYDCYSCDLNITSQSPNVYRLNLEAGRFNQPYSLDNEFGSSLCLNYDYHFLLVGTQSGKLYGFDPRMRQKVCSADLGADFNEVYNSGITALSFRDSTNLGVGFDKGIVAFYDIRSSNPIISKDHMNGEQIKKISFINTHEGGEYVAAADSHSLKIYNRHDVKMFTTIEPNDPINDYCIFPNSGLILFANDSPHSGIYFIPSLGQAPRWCSFLDNITEEMEEVQSAQIYDDYKFITRAELDELGLSNLIGTESLRAYMHGFFINVRLYKKVKSAHDPLTYQEFKRNTIRQKLMEERSDRLKLVKLPTVNKDLAQQLLKTKPKITDSDIVNPLGDERFSKMFKDDNFEIDKDNEHFKLLSNVGALKKMRIQKPVEEKNISEEENNESLTESEEEIEDITSDEEQNSEYELTSSVNQNDVFSTKSSNLTIEEKLKQNNYKTLKRQNETVFGDKEMKYIPKDDKIDRERKVFEKLKNHVNEKAKSMNNNKRLPFATRKLLKTGHRKLKLKIAKRH